MRHSCRYLLFFVAVVIECSALFDNGRYFATGNRLTGDLLISNNIRGMVPKPNGIPNLSQENLNQPERVKIQVYYECLCPDCRHFDSNGFKQTVAALGPYLDINLYPYGKAQTEERNGQIAFTCQHGPAECYGNKLHACAIDHLQNITAAVFYNSCLMDYSREGQGSDDQAADVCAVSMGISSEAIKQCAKGGRGTTLLQYYGVESMKANFRYVPHILINGVQNNGVHFLRDVCNAFTDPPEACNGQVF